LSTDRRFQLFNFPQVARSHPKDNCSRPISTPSDERNGTKCQIYLRPSQDRRPPCPNSIHIIPLPLLKSQSFPSREPFNLFDALGEQARAMPSNRARMPSRVTTKKQRQKGVIHTLILILKLYGSANTTNIHFLFFLSFLFYHLYQREHLLIV